MRDVGEHDGGSTPPPLFRTTLADGATLAWRDTGGDGPVVVLCHPHTGRSESFAGRSRFLAGKGYRAIAPDRRSYGVSAGPTTGGTQGGDLATVLEAAGATGPAALIGVAAGTVAAVDFALGAPHRVRRLMLCGSLMAVTDPDWQARLAQVQEPLLAGRSLAEKELSIRFRRDRPAGVRLWERIASENAASGAGEPPQATGQTASFADLRSVPFPLLLATGTDDLYLPPGLMNRALRRLPNAASGLFEAAAHAPHVEVPEAFDTAVLAFLNGLE